MTTLKPKEVECQVKAEPWMNRGPWLPDLCSRHIKLPSLRVLSGCKKGNEAWKGNRTWCLRLWTCHSLRFIAKGNFQIFVFTKIPQVQSHSWGKFTSKKYLVIFILSWFIPLPTRKQHLFLFPKKLCLWQPQWRSQDSIPNHIPVSMAPGFASYSS